MSGTEAVFECARCGICCQGVGGIVLSDKDIVRLADYLGMHRGSFLEIWTELRGRLPSLRAGEDGYCVFFAAGQGCTIHPARPDVCRAWPFFRGNLEDASSFQMAREDCRGIANVPHAQFREAGLDYLTSHALTATAEDAPNALRVAHLLNPHTS
ncbi:YkgJ family cysteine cluster protein [Megalodesulfovibrio paquesii]